MAIFGPLVLGNPEPIELKFGIVDDVRQEAPHTKFGLRCITGWAGHSGEDVRSEVAHFFVVALVCRVNGATQRDALYTKRCVFATITFFAYNFVSKVNSLITVDEKPLLGCSLKQALSYMPVGEAAEPLFGRLLASFQLGV